MLKFGKVIDLEKLEKMGVNKIADDLKEKLQKDELKRMKELAEAEVCFIIIYFHLIKNLNL